MRFCMVTTFYPPYHFGGDGIFVQALARALVSQGHHVDVHCEDAYRLRCREQPANQADHDGVVVHRLRSPFGLLSPLLTQQTGRPGLKARELGHDCANVQTDPDTGSDDRAGAQDDLASQTWNHGDRLSPPFW